MNALEAAEAEAAAGLGDVGVDRLHAFSKIGCGNSIVWS